VSLIPGGRLTKSRPSRSAVSVSNLALPASYLPGQLRSMALLRRRWISALLRADRPEHALRFDQQ
jgi:hypothetical protein